MLCDFIVCLVPRLAFGASEMNELTFLNLRSENEKMEHVQFVQQVTSNRSLFTFTSVLDYGLVAQ
jgi:hypothetical protein